MQPGEICKGQRVNLTACRSSLKGLKSAYISMERLFISLPKMDWEKGSNWLDFAAPTYAG